VLHSLSYNYLRSEGAAALAPALAANAELTSINLLSNMLDVESANMLLKINAEKPNLHTLCGLTHEETQIDLSNLVQVDVGLGPGDAVLLAPEISVMAAELTKIDLSFNEFGPEGAAALAPALAANAELTVANVLNNNLDIESAKLLVNAVKEKDISLCGIQRDQTEANFMYQRLQPPDAVLLASDMSKAGVSAD